MQARNATVIKLYDTRRASKEIMHFPFRSRIWFL